MDSPEKQTAAVTPERLFQALHGFQLTAALRAAIGLDIFTAIGEGKDTSASLAGRCRAAERGVRILCDYLVVQKFLTKDDSHYGLTSEAAAYLDRRSPECLAAMADFLVSDEMLERYRKFDECVRRGGRRLGAAATFAENPVRIEFAKSMGPLLEMEADSLASLVSIAGGKVRKVLDLAAAHGLFGIAVARRNPDCRVHALDWQPILKVAEENAAKAGVRERFHLLPGSAFETKLDSDYDVVLLSNFLHHFDVPTCERILRRVHAALIPGGHAFAIEFVPDEDRVSPPGAAVFSLTMLASTPSGDAYTYSEWRAMFQNAGFCRTELYSLPPLWQHVVIAQK